MWNFIAIHKYIKNSLEVSKIFQQKNGLVFMNSFCLSVCTCANACKYSTIALKCIYVNHYLNDMISIYDDPSTIFVYLQVHKEEFCNIKACGKKALTEYIKDITVLKAY